MNKVLAMVVEVENSDVDPMPGQPRSAVATPIIRGGQVQSLVPVPGLITHTVRPSLASSVGRVQNSPGTVQWTTIPASTIAGRYLLNRPYL